MKVGTIGIIALLTGLFSFGLSGAACSGPEDDTDQIVGAEDDPSATAAIRGSRRARDAARPRDAAGLDGGGSAVDAGAAPVPAVGCEICTKANVCCTTVGGGPLCTYNAATCASLGTAARAGYVNACQQLLWTVRNAWSNRPPAVCM